MDSPDYENTMTDQTQTPNNIPPSAYIPKTTAKWVNDTGVTQLTETLFKQPKVDKPLPDTNGDDITTGIQYETPTDSIAISTSTPSKRLIRFNLIHLRNTTTSTPTLKQFKSFATVLRNIDQTLAILPYQNDKQHI